jgi:hypothetical protein
VSEDLRQACLDCLPLDRAEMRAYAEKYSWRASAEEFVRNLNPIPTRRRAASGGGCGG